MTPEPAPPSAPVLSPCGHADKSWLCPGCSLRANFNVFHCTVCLVERPMGEKNVYLQPQPLPPTTLSRIDQDDDGGNYYDNYVDGNGF